MKLYVQGRLFTRLCFNWSCALLHCKCTDIIAASFFSFFWIARDGEKFTIKANVTNNYKKKILFSFKHATQIASHTVVSLTLRCHISYMCFTGGTGWSNYMFSKPKNMYAHNLFLVRRTPTNFFEIALKWLLFLSLLFFFQYLCCRDSVS